MAYIGVGGGTLGMVVLSAILVNIAATLLVFHRGTCEVAVRLGRALHFGWLADHVERFQQAVSDFRNQSTALALFLGLCLLEQLMPIVGKYLLLRTFAINLPFTWVVIGVPVICLVTRLPISMNSLGINEGIYAFVFSFAGVPLSAALLISLADRVLSLLSLLPGAFYPWQNSSVELTSNQLEFAASHSRIQKS